MGAGASHKASDDRQAPTGKPHRIRYTRMKPDSIPSSSKNLDERDQVEILSARKSFTGNEGKAYKTGDAVLPVEDFRKHSQPKPQESLGSTNSPKTDGFQGACETGAGQSRIVSDENDASTEHCKIAELRGEENPSVESNSCSVSSHQFTEELDSRGAAESFEFDSLNLAAPLPSPHFTTTPILVDSVEGSDLESSSLTLHLGLHRIKTRPMPSNEDVPSTNIKEASCTSPYSKPGEAIAGKAGESSSRHILSQSESQIKGSNHFLSGDGNEGITRIGELSVDSATSIKRTQEQGTSRSGENRSRRRVKTLQTPAASTIIQSAQKGPMNQGSGVTEGNATVTTTIQGNQGNIQRSSASSLASQTLGGGHLNSKSAKFSRHRTEREVPPHLTLEFRSNCNRVNDTEGPLKDLDVIKETAPTKMKSFPRVSRASKKKRLPNYVKSFSQELGPAGGLSRMFPRRHSDNDLEEVLGALKARFNTAKEEVNVELSAFSADLVDILDKRTNSCPGMQEVEDLLIVARRCTMMSAFDFQQECGNIVHELDAKKQELPMGLIKQLHIRMLFILSRYTRLLQFQKDTAAQEEGPFHIVRQCLREVPCFERTRPSNISKKGKHTMNAKKVCQDSSYPCSRDELSSSVSYGLPNMADESCCYSEMRKQMLSDVTKDNNTRATTSDYLKDAVVLADENMDKMQPGNALASKDIKSDSGYDSLTRKLQVALDKRASSKSLSDNEVQESSSTAITPPKQAEKTLQGYWTDQESVEEPDHFLCRICEEVIPTSNLEAHSVICAFADNCDGQGLSLNERLKNLADFLERLPELNTLKNSRTMSGDSLDVLKSLKLSLADDSLSPTLSDFHGRVGEVRFDDLYASDHSSMEDLKGWSNAPNFKPLVGTKSSSSAGSLTPRSTLTTPRTSQLDIFWADQSTLVDYDDIKQICELAEIAKRAANKSSADERALDYLNASLHDLHDVLDRCKNYSFTVGTFGRRIENILREKYLLVYESNDHQKLDMAVGFSEDDSTWTDDGINSLKSTPVHCLNKDRTTINDFEILKPISHGAFGRVFLARKRTTGDFFAIKALRKVDMIRKNAVENILAERDILITVCNPFVVRFFYSFTSRENLYLVMEYLNGGDLYSLLKNMGCLEEHVARVYIAELVLALEYLHSLGVVHRDLKPDNILIAHDGHIKLTDFGLSTIGLINSTDDLTGDTSNGAILTDKMIHDPVDNGQPMQRHRKRSAVGTPDYLAPEILLGREHAHPADWWSTGVILFECLTGIPPFNAEHPQIIFDNILNRKIPWPSSEFLSTEARDLIDRLLTEDPKQRLGSKGAVEVKLHPFFQDINWDTLARQKAAFVPVPESIDDTSYFTPRHPSANSNQGNGDSSDCSCSSINTSSVKGGQDEEEDQFQDLADFESSHSVKNTFNNFSFKNLSQLASINYDLLSQNAKEPLKSHIQQPSES